MPGWSGGREPRRFPQPAIAGMGAPQIKPDGRFSFMRFVMESNIFAAQQGKAWRTASTAILNHKALPGTPHNWREAFRLTDAGARIFPGVRSPAPPGAVGHDHSLTGAGRPGWRELVLQGSEPSLRPTATATAHGQTGRGNFTASRAALHDLRARVRTPGLPPAATSGVYCERASTVSNWSSGTGFASSTSRVGCQGSSLNRTRFVWARNCCVFKS